MSEFVQTNSDSTENETKHEMAKVVDQISKGKETGPVVVVGDEEHEDTDTESVQKFTTFDDDDEKIYILKETLSSHRQ